MSNLLSIQALQTKADALAAEINAVDPDITFIYAVHNSGQLLSSLQMIEDSILAHPAGSIAALLLRRHLPPIEPSAFQGLAARQKTHWLSLSKSTTFLGIISINVDQYDDYYEALFDLYRHTWHGIETVDLCQDRAFLETFGDRPLVPKRGPLGEARVNLKSDIFACLVLQTEGYDDVIDRTAKKRALQALRRKMQEAPEKFPFPLVAQATHFAAAEILEHLDSDRPRLEKCKDLTQEIAAGTTDEQIRQWWRFCEPAQEMAWRGYGPDVILTASLLYGDDPYVRSITHQIQDFTGIQPAPPEFLEEVFNPFIDIHRNEKTHQFLIQETFDTVLAQGVNENSTRPFLVTAAKQNQDLVQGRFLGWCASALQGAARAFDQAALQGRPAPQAAQLEFQMTKSVTPLQSLYKLTTQVLEQQKNGHIILLKDLPGIAASIPDLGAVLSSIHDTREFLKDEELATKIESESLDMVLMPNTPALARTFGLNVVPKIPAEHAFPMEYAAPAPVLDFVPGQGAVLPPQTHRPRIEDRQDSLPAATGNSRDKILPTEGETGLSLDFEEAAEEEEEKK